MTTAKERKALLAYAAWWHGEGPVAFSWNEVFSLLPVANDEPTGRGFIAESLAYDGTDGP